MSAWLSPPSAECPLCESSEVTWGEGAVRGPLSLLFARVVEALTRRLFPLRLRCKHCRHHFEHLHVAPRVVIGYHACRRDFAHRLLAGRVGMEEWLMSENSYDWLGKGIYFWEHAPGRAWQWARERFGDDGAVVATEIKLGRCLDLGDTMSTELLRQTYQDIMEYYQRTRQMLPINGGREFKLRRLDRLIIDRVTEVTDQHGVHYYQTVRCPFEEGDAIYPGAMLKTQSHIQIAVRERGCIDPTFFTVPRRGD